MITIPLPAGWTVTLQQSSNGNPPDRQGGMSTNCSTLWCRLTNTSGADSGWRRVESDKSITKVRRWWDAVEYSRNDIRDAWIATVGGEWPPDGIPE